MTAAPRPAPGAPVPVRSLCTTVAETYGGRWVGTIEEAGRVTWASPPCDDRDEAERRTAAQVDLVLACLGLEAPR